MRDPGRVSASGLACAARTADHVELSIGDAGTGRYRTGGENTADQNSWCTAGGIAEVKSVWVRRIALVAESGSATQLVPNPPFEAYAPAGIPCGVISVTTATPNPQPRRLPMRGAAAARCAELR